MLCQLSQTFLESSRLFVSVIFWQCQTNRPKKGTFSYLRILNFPDVSIFARKLWYPSWASYPLRIVRLGFLIFEWFFFIKVNISLLATQTIQQLWTANRPYISHKKKKYQQNNKTRKIWIFNSFRRHTIIYLCRYSNF